MHQHYAVNPMHGFNEDEEKKKNEEPTLKPLKWTKSLRKHKGKTQVFIWGKAIPPNMFPQNQDQLTPWNSPQLTRQNIWDISAAREGQHCFAIGRNDWCFVWGKTIQNGALGLGNNSRSTSPYILKTLAKENVKQACCSAVHSLCITDKMIIYGCGSKLLTLLNCDTFAPTPLPYLAGKGLNRISAANTHSLAWRTRSADVYAFGITGPWLGFGDDDQKQTFGKISIQFGVSFADCSSQYSLFVLNNGFVGACGVNEYGRMAVGKAIRSTYRIVWSAYLRDIVLCSAGSFHSGFVDCFGDAFTVGVGMHYRLADSKQNIAWIPKQIKALMQWDICQIECVGDRTYVITTDGDLIMFGKEAVTGRVHQKGFLYNYLKHYRVYKVCGAKDFCVAFGVERKQAHHKQPDIDNEAVDEMKPDETMNDMYRLAGDVIDQNHPKCIDEGNDVREVYGNFVSMQQMQYDARYMQAYAPPKNTVYAAPPANMDGNNNNNINNNNYQYNIHHLPNQEKF